MTASGVWLLGLGVYFIALRPALLPEDPVHGGDAFPVDPPRGSPRSCAGSRPAPSGADHAFRWKPKLRIPDIYENSDNQRALASLLHACECCDTAEAVVEAIGQRGECSGTLEEAASIHDRVLTKGWWIRWATAARQGRFRRVLERLPAATAIA